MKLLMLDGVMLDSRLTISERLELSMAKEEAYLENKDRKAKVAVCSKNRGMQELGEDRGNLKSEMTIR